MDLSKLENVPIGDLDFLNHIAEVSSLSMAKTLVEKAPESVRKELDAIKSAIDQKNTENLKDACHALRGACYSIRAIRLADLTAEIESKASDISVAQKLFPLLEEISEQTIAWWQEVLDKDLIED